MDFPTPGTGAQYWSSRQQPRYQTPTNYNHQLNPSVPGFQPTGSEMQRFQQQPPTPPSSNSALPGDMMQMRNMMLTSHFSYTKDITGLEQKTQKNIEEIEGVKNAVRNDMRTLQGEIEGLKQQVVTNKQNDGAISVRSRAGHGLPMPHQVSEEFTNDNLAEMYLDEAETMEKTAAKLRDQAAEMSNNVSRKLVTMKLLEGPKGDGEEAKTKATFACCGATYGSIQELLEHVKTTHGSKSQVELAEDIPDMSAETTPTHVPPRHAKLNNAVEIKTSEETAAQKLEEEVAEIKREISEKNSTPVKPDAQAGPSSTDNESWIPLVVRRMKPASPLNVEHNTETFTWEFLNLTFRGEQWSPGFYFVSEKSPLPSKSYWVLDGEFEPYLPPAPGHHGAKLTALFNGTESAAGEAPDESNYMNVPVFVCDTGRLEYTYLGNYSQTRFSDKLDIDTTLDRVPEKVRRFWAEQLAAQGRPDWVTRELIQHFWPKPGYGGPIPTDSAVSTPATGVTQHSGASDVLEKRVIQSLHNYALELKEWKKEAQMKAQHLSVDNLMAAFEAADADEEPGLRLWWEYMEFQSYDQKFYEYLVDMKHKEKPQAAKARMPVPPKAKVEAVGKTVAKSEVETVIPVSPTKLKPSRYSATMPIWQTGTKRHTAGVKPWEKADEEAKTAVKTPSGDLEAAKVFAAQATKSKPPHQRRVK